MNSKIKSVAPFVRYLLKFIVLSFILAPAYIPLNVYALAIINPLIMSSETGAPIESFTDFAEAVALGAARIAFPIAAIAIIVAGFLFITAGGNEEKIRRARKTFYWILIGTAVVVGAFVLAFAFKEFIENL